MIVDGFHLESLGGDSMNRVVVAGAGGAVAVNRTTVTIDNTRIIARAETLSRTSRPPGEPAPR